MKDLDEEGMRKWEGPTVEFFHYGYDEPREVHYELYEDARRYDVRRGRRDVPALVFQGARDELVDPRWSRNSSPRGRR